MQLNIFRIQQTLFSIFQITTFGNTFSTKHGIKGQKDVLPQVSKQPINC